MDIGTIATANETIYNKDGARVVTYTYKVVGVSDTVEGLYRTECISHIDPADHDYMGKMGWHYASDLTVAS